MGCSVVQDDTKSGSRKKIFRCRCVLSKRKLGQMDEGPRPKCPHDMVWNKKKGNWVLNQKQSHLGHVRALLPLGSTRKRRATCTRPQVRQTCTDGEEVHGPNCLQKCPGTHGPLRRVHVRADGPQGPQQDQPLHRSGLRRRLVQAKRLGPRFRSKKSKQSLYIRRRRN